MPKLDLKKELKTFYSAKQDVVTFLEVPKLQYAMIDGYGNPNTSPLFQDAVEQLYNISYKIKFLAKGEGRDYTVMPLEGLWWADDMNQFSVERKDEWKWTLMILQPDFITEEAFQKAVHEVQKKRTISESLRLETFDEGLSAQILHLGSYAEEGPTVEKLHREILNQGFQLRGKHHEIYLGDPRKAEPAKLKTIVRQPVSK